jgi:Leucine-rich repeat (LRR) protein
MLKYIPISDETVPLSTKTSHFENFNNIILLRPDGNLLLLQVTHLKACNNTLTSVPDVVGHLTNLTRLDLSNNNITQVSRNIFTRVSLQ